MPHLAFRSRLAAAVPSRWPVAATPPAGRPRLAMIVTGDTLCGVAAYASRLARHLGDTLEVTKFELDQDLMRGRHPRLCKLADAQIGEICRQLATFDAVNLQLEHGTLGARTRDICRRFAWIVDAAPRISVTFHSLYAWQVFDRGAFFSDLLSRNPGRALRARAGFRRRHRLSIEIPRHLRRAQQRKAVTAIVHNRRDRRDLERVHGIGEVYDHPLTYLGAPEAAAIRGAAARRRFPVLDTIADGDILIGAFGFLNQYKGFETAIAALHRLPATYHLLIFGGVHPNEIAAHEPVHPYVARLLADAYVGAALPERLAATGGTAALTVALDRSLADLLVSHPKDLSARVHFMGALDEADFLAGMAICDTIVFPYLEVGQSASGPVAQAVELGCRVIASRTRAFLEFARYHDRRIEFFDIGNHLELAQLVQARPAHAIDPHALDYTIASNAEIYCLANGISPGAGLIGRVAPRDWRRRVRET
jgi:glycosyltransferase involved in cell wall biosynthesis